MNGAPIKIDGQRLTEQGYSSCTTVPMFESTIHATNTRAFQSLLFRGKRALQKERPFRPKVCGGILIVKTKDGTTKYALVQGRYTGKWSFPKGHSLQGESPIDCSRREIAEETSIDELPKHTHHMRLGYGHYYVYELVAECPLVARDTHEVMDTRWVTLEEMATMSVNADVSRYIRTVRIINEN